METIELNEKLEGKKIILRTDLNLPIENQEPQKTERFYRYLETIKKLSETDAKTLIIAHQGRPGRKDFLRLNNHADYIQQETGITTRYVKSFFGKEVSETFTKMNKGEVALLENIRLLSEELKSQSPEMHAKDHFVKHLSQQADMFINDAFSAAHRSHGSMVGFTKTLPAYAGPVMQREIDSCNKVRKEFEKGTLVLGGEKPEDIIGMLQNMIEDVENVLLGGIPAEVALITQGFELGKKKEWIEEKGYNAKQNELKQLIEKYDDKIILPEDLATQSGSHKVSEIPNEELTWDIGNKTAEKYTEIIKNSDAILAKGPMGAFEEHETGTKRVIDAIADSQAYTVLGGGHTSSLVKRFNYGLEDFSHVSIAGGAFVRYMSGEDLAAITALKRKDKVLNKPKLD